MSRPSIFLYAAMIAALTYFSGAVVQLWFFGAPESVRYFGIVTYSPFMKYFSYSVYGMSLLLVLGYGSTILSQVRRIKTGWILLLYILASCLWAIDSKASFTVVQVILLAFMFGLYMAKRLTLPQLLKVLAWFYALVILAAYFLIIRYPYLGTYAGFDGSWRGAFGDRNEMAFHCNLALAVYLTLWKSGVSGTTKLCILAPLMLAIVALIINSNSATGLLCMGVLVLAAYVLPLLRNKTGSLLFVGLPLLIVLVLGSMVVQNYKSDIVSALGKDETLTGRTGIWDQFMVAAQERPVLGFGAQSIFVRDRRVMTASFFDTQAGMSYAYAAHNMYISMLVKYGLLGMVLFVFMLASMIGSALSRKKNTDDVRASFYGLTLCVILFFGGSLTIDAMGVVWLFYGILLSVPKPVVTRLPDDPSQEQLS